MGFLDFFKKTEKKKEVVVKPVTVSIHTLQDWFDKDFSDELAKANEQVKQIHSRIVEGFSNIEHAVNVFGEASFEKGDKTYAAANMVKDVFVKKIKSATNIQADIELNYSSLTDFHATTAKTLENLKSMSPKQAFLLSRYFKKESANIIDNIKQTEQQLTSFKDFLDADGKVIWLAEQVELKTKEQLRLLEKVKSLEEKIKTLKGEVKMLKESAAKNSSQIEDILKSKEWGDYNSLKNEIHNTEAEIREIRDTIDRELAAVNRPLKKFRHTNHEKFADINNFNAIMQDKEQQLKTILNNVINLADENKIILKPREREKVLSLIIDLDSHIPELKAKYKELKKQKEQKEELIKKLEIAQKKQLTEDKIAKNTKEIKDLELDITNIKKEKEEVNKELLEQKKHLENLILKNSSKKLNIKF